MAKRSVRYRAQANVLGLRRGQEFESNHGFYRQMEEAGWLSVVGEGVSEYAGDQLEFGSAEGAGDGSIPEGGDEGSGASPGGS